MSKVLWRRRCLILVAMLLNAADVGKTNPSKIRVAPVKAGTPRQVFMTGRVFDFHTQSPLAAAWLYGESGSTGSFFEGSTSRDGRFRIGPLAPAPDYSFIVSFGETNNEYSARALDVAVPATGVELDIGLIRCGVMEGTVRDAAGDAVAGASVSCSLQEIYDSLSSADADGVTDKAGHFRIDTVHIPFSKRASGTHYSVVVRHPRHSSAERRILVRPQPSPVAMLEIKLPPRAVIRGRITSEGRPLPRAEIWASGVRGFDENLHLFTDANGRFSGSVSAPDTYQLSAQGQYTAAAQLSVKVEPGQSILVQRDLAGPGAIAGRITDLQNRAVAGAAVSLQNGGSPAGVEPIVTGKDGRYRFAKVSPIAGYEIYVDMPGASENTGYPRAEAVRVVSGQTTIVNLRGDVIRPRGRILRPRAGAAVSGWVTLEFEAGDNQSVDGILLGIDGIGIDHKRLDEFSEAFHSPWRSRVRRALRWDSRRVKNGHHVLTLEVRDLHNNFVRRSIGIVVRNVQRQNSLKTLPKPP